MARRKHVLLEQEADSSSASDPPSDLDRYSDEDPDAAAERRRWDDSSRKRRRRNSKDHAVYGVFGDNDDLNDDEDRNRRLRRTQTFVPAVEEEKDGADDAAAVDAKTDDENNDSGQGDEDDEDEDDMDESGSSSEREPAPPRVRVDDEDAGDSPGAGGVGLGSRQSIGSEFPSGPDSASVHGLPSAFETNQNKSRRSFLSTSSQTQTQAQQPAQKPKQPNLSTSEKKHFASLSNQGGIGVKLLEKMGWATGTGLGSTNQGIVTPLQGKSLPKGAGLAFGKDPNRKGVSERDSENEEMGKKSRASKGGFGESTTQIKHQKAEPWKKKDKVLKKKVQHRTYEEIVGGDDETMPSDPGLVTDLSGNALPSLSHIPVPSSSSTQLPELRHNTALIVEQTKADIDHMAREASRLHERRRWIDGQELKARQQLKDDETRMNRLREITKVTSGIVSLAKKLKPSITVQELLDTFSEPFEELIGLYPDEYDTYHLDDVVIATIAPVMKRAWSTWEPLEDPSAYVLQMKHWKANFRMERESSTGIDDMQVDIFGNPTETKPKISRDGNMTAYENLLWSVWIPRVRSAINNEWDPSQPDPVLELYSSWEPLLPRFLRDNILDQLILPKVRKAVDDWQVPHKVPTTTTAGTLHGLVFPWLEYAGLERMDEIIDDAKRKLRSWLKSWKTSDDVPQGLEVWRNVLPRSDWDSLLLKSVIPRLSTLLRDQLKVNPRQQDMEPLLAVLKWRPLLSHRTISALLEEFVKKWIDTLYIWLTHGGASEEVVKWYQWWTEFFVNNSIEDVTSVSYGTTVAMDLMNEATRYGDDSEKKQKLVKPELRFPSARSKPSTKKSKKEDKSQEPLPEGAPEESQEHPEMEEEITLREIVEEMAAENDLLFLPTGRSHEGTGERLFRISKSIDGKGGATIYIRDDVVWMLDQGDYRPVGIEDMIEKAKSGQ